MEQTLSLNTHPPQHKSPYTPFTLSTIISSLLLQSLSLLDQPLNQSLFKPIKKVLFPACIDLFNCVFFLPPVPTSTIHNAGASAITSESATIHWSPPHPEDQNGVVSYRVNVTDISREITFQQTTTNTFISLSTLRPFTSYIIRIAAYTIVGDGPYSGPIHVVTREAGRIVHEKNNHTLLWISYLL